jgi:hypothetical protein
MGLVAWAFSAALLSEPFHGHRAQVAAFAMAVVLEVAIVTLAWLVLGALLGLVLFAAFVLLDFGLRWAFRVDKAQFGTFAIAVVLEFAIVTITAIFLGILTSLVLLAAFVLLDLGLRWRDPKQKRQTQLLPLLSQFASYGRFYQLCWIFSPMHKQTRSSVGDGSDRHRMGTLSSFPSEPCRLSSRQPLNLPKTLLSWIGGMVTSCVTLVRRAACLSFTIRRRKRRFSSPQPNSGVQC